jgi:2-methylisocitrate lyase-like PEP mutase family enzyme
MPLTLDKEGVAMTEIDRRPTNAEAFHRMHAGSELLILANAWDGVSARMLVNLGAKAVATSSAAVAWSHGYPDGNALPVPLLLTSLRDIAHVVTVPMTTDIEGGYSDNPDTVGETVASLLDLGVVGINLEDGRSSPDLLCAKIQAVRESATRAAVRLFVNARTDVFLKKNICGPDTLAEAIARSDRYAEAGADGIFVPGITNADAIKTLAREIPRPLNVMARPGLPPARELRQLGVRRLSAAAWLARVALRAFRETAATFLATGDSDLLAGASGLLVDYNAMLSEAHEHPASR